MRLLVGYGRCSIPVKLVNAKSGRHACQCMLECGKTASKTGMHGMFVKGAIRGNAGAGAAARSNVVEGPADAYDQLMTCCRPAPKERRKSTLGFEKVKVKNI